MPRAVLVVDQPHVMKFAAHLIRRRVLPVLPAVLTAVIVLTSASSLAHSGTDNTAAVSTEVSAPVPAPSATPESAQVVPPTIVPSPEEQAKRAARLSALAPAQPSARVVETVPTTTTPAPAPTTTAAPTTTTTTTTTATAPVTPAPSKAAPPKPAPPKVTPPKVTPTPPTTTTTATTTTPAPAPVPTPSPTSNPAFTGDFETGTASQWNWGAQCANTGVPSALGTLNLESQVVGQGTYAAQFNLPAATTVNSCETLDKRQIGLGSDDYYGLMIRFPSNWVEPSPAGWGMSLAQFNFQGIWGSPVQLSAHADHVSLIMQTGLCNAVSTSSPGCANTSGVGGNVAQMAAVPAPLALNVWHELIVHVHWATDSSGVIEVWHRLLGSTAWTKTVSLSGYPTVQWTAAGGPSTLGGSVTSDKIGAYRGAASFPLSIWQDDFVRTTSFTATAAKLP